MLRIDVIPVRRKEWDLRIEDSEGSIETTEIQKTEVIKKIKQAMKEERRRFRKSLRNNGRVDVTI